LCLRLREALADLVQDIANATATAGAGRSPSPASAALENVIQNVSEAAAGLLGRSGGCRASHNIFEYGFGVEHGRRSFCYATMRGT
jgi:hypothetical protein